MSARSAGLDLAEYEALLRADLAGFAERAFCELYPQTEFLASWHHRVIAAKLQAVFEGRIRRLIINKAYEIDNIAFIFHSGAWKIRCVSARYQGGMSAQCSGRPAWRREVGDTNAWLRSLP